MDATCTGRTNRAGRRESAQRVENAEWGTRKEQLVFPSAFFIRNGWLMEPHKWVRARARQERPPLAQRERPPAAQRARPGRIRKAGDKQLPAYGSNYTPHWREPR
jgi:hypothetical protein